MIKNNKTKSTKCPKCKCDSKLLLTENKFSPSDHDESGSYTSPCLSLYDCLNCGGLWDSIELSQYESLQIRLNNIRLNSIPCTQKSL